MKPYVGCIVQSRRGGTRFPGKTLEPINGRPVLEHVVSRCRMAKLVDKVVIASPQSPGCCLNEDIYIGSESDVLDRYYQCADEYEFDVIVRITADCPLIPPFEIDRCIQAFLEGGFDYVTNRPAMLDGFDVEVFSFDALQEAWHEAKEPYDREHVTPFIKRNEKLKRVNLEAPKLSLDTPEDLERIKEWIGTVSVSL